MKVSIYSRSLDTNPVRVADVLDAVKGHGLDGCLFPSPLDVSATLDLGEIREARAYADEQGLYLDSSVGQINPFHFAARPDILAAGHGEFRTGMERLLIAAREMGTDSVFFVVGALVDRFSQSVPWADQVAATTQFLHSMRPFLLDQGMRLDVKTHEEITTDECVRLVESVGTDVMGIGLDPVNVLVRLEDPVAAARRVAPYCTRVFLSDADLFFTSTGIERKLRAVGDGIVDWPGTLDVLRAAGLAPTPTFTVELHRGQFSMPIFDQAWMAADPSIRMAELAEVVRLTVVSEAKLADPDRPPREAYQLNVLERLPSTLAYLPTLLRTGQRVTAGVSA